MIRTRPIVTWPGKATPPNERRPKRYDASPQRTRKELLQELELLGAREAFIQAAYQEDQIRLDGLPRSDARPAHPGIILTYTLGNGSTYQLPCDTFQDAEQNLRAIVLTLQRLRLIEETGVRTHGAQYAGFKALPPSPPRDFHVVEDAARALAQWSGYTRDPLDLLRHRDHFDQAYRQAAKKLHPDAGGDAQRFALLGKAKDLIERHYAGGAR